MRSHSSRPLQLREVIAAAEEHLVASALPGLEAAYLPERLAIGVSPADHKSLAPFADRLAEDLAAAHRRLASGPRLRSLASSLEIELQVEPVLAPAAAPRFVAGFPGGARAASWAATPRRAAPESAPSSTLALELLLTLGSTGGTAREMVVDLRLGDPGNTPGLAGKLCEEDLFPALPLPPGALEGTGLSGHCFRVRLTRGGTSRRPRLDVPSGALVIGRSAQLAQLVPPDAPRNLSGRHLAVARAEHGGFWAIDLGSTNGTFVAGVRLEPYRPLRLDLPAELAVGTEGSLRLEVRSGRLDPVEGHER